MKAKTRWLVVLSSLVAIGLLAIAASAIINRTTPSTTTQFEEQWLVSPHNWSPAELFPNQSTNPGCVKCHNSEWFVRIQTKGEAPPAKALPAPPEYGHTCRTCHEVENPTNILTLRKVGDVTLPEHGDVVSAGIAASCISCHNARREKPEEYIKTSFRGTHEGTQAEMLSGIGAITYGETFGSSAHTIVTPKGCPTCHMSATPAIGERGHNQLGGHTLRMKWDGGSPNNSHDDVENVAACQQCHPGLDTFDRPARGDYDGDGLVEGVQTEVKGLLARLAAKLPLEANGNLPSDLTKTTLEQRMANYNYTLVLHDRSNGIHNTAYAVQVLRTTYEKLTGEKLPGDTINATPLVANRPVTSDAIEKRYIQWSHSPKNFNPRDPAVLAEFSNAPINSGCVKCHSSEWFVRVQTKGEAPPSANLVEPAEYSHVCSTCHAAADDETNMLRLRLVGNVTLPSYGDVVDAGVSAACMSCHNARRVKPEEYIKTSSRGTHGGPQADMLSGTGAITYGKKFASSSHIVAVEKKCAGCHMAATPAEGKPGHDQVGGHTYLVKWDNGTPNNPSDDVENVGACQGCHAGITTFDFPAEHDYDGDGVVEGVQTEIKGMLALLAKALPHNENGNVSIPSDLTKTTVEQRMANYNYTLVANDGSYGVHNFKYAVDTLQTSYKALTGKEIVPKAKDYSNVFFATLEKGLNMISLPLESKTPYTARSMANELGATIVIKIDAKSQRFLGFTAADAGDGFPIEGAKGYIVNVQEGKTVAFTGTAWTSEPPISAAPTNAGNTTWAFIVSGYALDENGVPLASNASTITVKNLRSGETAVSPLGTDGQFAAVWADLSKRGVVESGDRFEIRVRGSSGEVVSEPITISLNPEDLAQAYVHLKLVVPRAPKATLLVQNYPNPFNPETWVPFQLAQAADVTIQIYDIHGQLVRQLNLGRKEPGYYISRDRAAYWDGTNSSGERVSSGIYFYRLDTNGYSATRKMIVAK
jgi:hypothetical protein